MARVLGHKENFRVVVEPRGLGDLGFISMSDRMADMAVENATDEITSLVLGLAAR